MPLSSYCVLIITAIIMPADIAILDFVFIIFLPYR
jgi:hypothetical protein